MKIKTSLIILSLITFAAISCKKSKYIAREEFCWQLVDPLGNSLNIVCNKTEAEMQFAYPTLCSYYKLGDDYCWLVDSTIFIKDKPGEYINLFLKCANHSSAVKVDCDYCQKWYSRQKRTYKPDSTFTFSLVRVEQYCGDTVRTLFQGRQIILKETADSLIILQFSNNGIF